MEATIYIIILIVMVVKLFHKIWDNNRKVIVYIILPKRKYFTLKIRNKTCNHIKYFFNPYNYNKFPEVFSSDEMQLDVFYANFTKIDKIPDVYMEIIKRNNFEIF